MVKHIVLFKLKDEVPAEEKLIVMTKFMWMISIGKPTGRIEVQNLTLAYIVPNLV